jgi:hypothetical protein
MDRREFLELRNLPDKVIDGDIEFTSPAEVSPLLVFENIPVGNSLGLDVRLNGKYNPLLPSVVFNFRVITVGAVCRLEVNGTVHNGHRNHKHSLHLEEDPRRNLPTNVHPRPDLEGKTARQIWETLCREAHIRHNGRFVDPERAVSV